MDRPATRFLPDALNTSHLLHGSGPPLSSHNCWSSIRPKAGAKGKGRSDSLPPHPSLAWCSPDMRVRDEFNAVVQGGSGGDLEAPGMRADRVCALPGFARCAPFLCLLFPIFPFPLLFRSLSRFFQCFDAPRAPSAEGGEWPGTCG
jgi:hypothetical protein